MSIKNVTVAGGGILGGQIAFQSQFMGFNVTVYDVNDSALKHSEQLMTSYPDIYKNFYEDGQKADEVIENIRFSSNLADAVQDADLVIEAIPLRRISISNFRELLPKKQYLLQILLRSSHLNLLTVLIVQKNF